MTTSRAAIFACATILVAAVPIASALTDAHPDFHSFYGINNQFAEVDQNAGGASLHADEKITAMGVCFPAPIVQVAPTLIVSPGDVSDPSIGIGGACFPFETSKGTDAGETHRVNVMELTLTFLRPVYIPCVDVNGDGVCIEAEANPAGVINPHDDRVELCWSIAGQGFVYGSTTDPCNIEFYEQGSVVLDETMYVSIVGGVDADGQTVVTYGPSARGVVWLE